MLATIHISTSANARLDSWLETRATFWSEAENSVMSPTPTIVSATPNRKLSMRRDRTSHSRASNWPINRSDLPVSGTATAGAGPAFVSPTR